MIKIEDLKILIKNANMQFDKNGFPFLKCKGFSFGITGEEEKEELEKKEEQFKNLIKGKNWFSSIKIYGDLVELDNLLQEIENRDEKTKFTKTLLKNAYLRTFLINGILSIIVYCFDYKYKQRAKKKTKTKIEPKEDIKLKKVSIKKKVEVKEEKKPKKIVLPKKLGKIKLEDELDFDIFD